MSDITRWQQFDKAYDAIRAEALIVGAQGGGKTVLRHALASGYGALPGAFTAAFDVQPGLRGDEDGAVLEHDAEGWQWKTETVPYPITRATLGMLPAPAEGTRRITRHQFQLTPGGRRQVLIDFPGEFGRSPELGMSALAGRAADVRAATVRLIQRTPITLFFIPFWVLIPGAAEHAPTHLSQLRERQGYPAGEEGKAWMHRVDNVAETAREWIGMLRGAQDQGQTLLVVFSMFGDDWPLFVPPALLHEDAVRGVVEALQRAHRALGSPVLNGHVPIPRDLSFQSALLARVPHVRSLLYASEVSASLAAVHLALEDALHHASRMTKRPGMPNVLKTLTDELLALVEGWRGPCWMSGMNVISERRVRLGPARPHRIERDKIFIRPVLAYGLDLVGVNLPNVFLAASTRA